MYLFTAGVFCIPMPGVDAANAYQLADRLSDVLKEPPGPPTASCSTLE